ncbi:MAG: hypothetical protein Q4C30_06670 [Bacteroidia bacterium]|nr:hypothetical protein [Bacteroidia bacterium]
MEKKQNCDHCSLRRRYDEKPKSLLGRFWRWHINFCPGWREYFETLSEEEKESIRRRYDIKQ